MCLGFGVWCSGLWGYMPEIGCQCHHVCIVFGVTMCPHYGMVINPIFIGIYSPIVYIYILYIYICLGMGVFGLQLYGMDDHNYHIWTHLTWQCKAMALLPGVPCASKIPHLTLGTRENVPARHANDILEEIVSQGRTEGITRIKLPKAKEMGRMGDGDGRMHVWLSGHNINLYIYIYALPKKEQWKCKMPRPRGKWCFFLTGLTP